MWKALVIASKGQSMVTSQEHLLQGLGVTHQSFTPLFIQQSHNKHLLRAGTGLGAEHLGANNTFLAAWSGSQENR